MPRRLIRVLNEGYQNVEQLGIGELKDDVEELVDGPENKGRTELSKQSGKDAFLFPQSGLFRIP